MDENEQELSGADTNEASTTDHEKFGKKYGGPAPLPNLDVEATGHKDVGDVNGRINRLVLRYIAKHGDNQDHRAAVALLGELGVEVVRPVSEADEGDGSVQDLDDEDEPTSQVPKSDTLAQGGQETHPRKRKNRAAGKE